MALTSGLSSVLPIFTLAVIQYLARPVFCRQRVPQLLSDIQDLPDNIAAWRGWSGLGKYKGDEWTNNKVCYGNFYILSEIHQMRWHRTQILHVIKLW